jgi:lipopolysaccharide transport system ATP-binding protein
MQAVARLCDRVLLLQGGRLVMDGPGSDVVAHYLQTETGSGSEHVWHDRATAPGDDLVRMRSVRLVGKDGSLVDAADIREPIGVEVAFEVLRHGDVAVFPKIKLVDSQGDVAFNALDTRDQWAEPSPPGEYGATAWIPGNLLSEGLYTVDVNICSLGGLKLWPHARANEVVSFHVFDPVEGDSARGRYTGSLRGVVRPLLDWE